MGDAKFKIRTTDKGSVIYYENEALVLCKGFFIKFVNRDFKIEGADNETLKGLVKIAVLTRKEKDPAKIFDLIHKLGENHCFTVHRGFVYESIALFERELGKL
ncbi:hypothetical protein JC221_195 [Yersinia phage JC221]|nr:hypothetical protein JC221_195 [Yersinia phage JC221]